ncbi:hypothetical protein GCK32_014468 [Trichostrongylus colubriformis]|uniref:Uncharacterized protein n=1 Tax=Trichostrongylus colubriformis TaxID=6319 RepID=A0AAN8GDK2_TRICO
MRDILCLLLISYGETKVLQECVITQGNVPAGALECVMFDFDVSGTCGNFSPPARGYTRSLSDKDTCVQRGEKIVCSCAAGCHDFVTGTKYPTFLWDDCYRRDWATKGGGDVTNGEYIGQVYIDNEWQQIDGIDFADKMNLQQAFIPRTPSTQYYSASMQMKLYGLSPFALMCCLVSWILLSGFILFKSLHFSTTLMMGLHFNED